MAQAEESGDDDEEVWSWDDPGLSLRERKRRAAEEGWDLSEWQSMDDAADYFKHIPAAFRERLRRVKPLRAVKQFITLHRVGDFPRNQLPKGEFYPLPFTGKDPRHDGSRYAVDDGKGSKLEQLAMSLHAGKLRLRARCHPMGLRGNRGVYPSAEHPEVAMIGMSNVGKSSLLNAITRTMKLAKAGPIAGCTRTIDWYKALKLPLEIIDLPGYGFTAGADFGEAVADFVLQRKALRCCYVLVDARRGLVSPDWEFLERLGARGPQKVFVLTKCDRVKPALLAKSATLMLRDLQGMPGVSSRLLMTSSLKGNGMHDFRTDLCQRAAFWARQAARVPETQPM